MRRITQALLAGLIGVFALPAMAQDLTPVRFIHEWRFEGHVSPYLVALEKGYYRGEGLDVTIEPGTGSVDGINRIASGAYDMGSMDINALIKYRDTEGAVPIKAVLMTYDVPPFSLITLKDNNITGPKDLEGKILGAPAADAAFSHWPIVVEMNDVDPSKVQVENVSFAIREAMLAQGDVDAVTAFSSNALGLKAIGVPDEQIVILPMRDFGLELYGSAVMANPDFIENNPEAVAGFVRATIKGFLDAHADPDGAIDILMEYNPVAKPEIELERLGLINDCCYFTEKVKENGFGDVDMERLQTSIDQLASYHQFTNKPEASDIFTSEFLPPKEERMPE
jgi:NitT/TauT family transport system substrate-binding protein